MRIKENESLKFISLFPEDHTLPEETKVVTHVKQVNKETGEIIKDIQVSGTPLGSEWYAMYRTAMNQLLLDKKAPNSVVRVFCLLCNMQTYDNAVLCSRKYIKDMLGMSRKTVYTCLTYLIEHSFIMETTVNGNTAFIINPEASSCGKASIASRRKIFKMNPFGDKLLKTVDVSKFRTNPTDK